jgi:hypothetical protein
MVGIIRCWGSASGDSLSSGRVRSLIVLVVPYTFPGLLEAAPGHVDVTVVRAKRDVLFAQLHLSFQEREDALVIRTASV